MDGNPSSPLRVLFVAPDCNPQWHSLPALIAEYYLKLSSYADVTLVTQVRNRENIEPWIPEDSTVFYIDTESFHRPLYKLSSFLVGDPNQSMTLQLAVNYPGNMYFEFAVWKMLGESIQGGDYDIVHRASPMSPTIPSPLSKWCGAPFVIGPVLGGLPWPKAFKSEMRREGEWMHYFRGLHRLLPYYSSTYKHADAILAGYRHTATDIPKRDWDRVIEFSEGGIHPEEFPQVDKLIEGKARILFVGRMVPFKQPEILIRCFQNSEFLRRHQLIMVGDGPELKRLKALVEELGLQGCVEFTGSIPIQGVRDQMQSAHIFAFPSVREQGGGVITMASMSCTPSVVVEYGGPAYRVPDYCGVKVPLGTVEEITQGFTRALEGLVSNPDKTRELGMEARRYTEKYYSWQWKVGKTLEIYDWVLGRRRDKPDYWS